MIYADLYPLLPYMILAGTALILVLVVSARRHHALVSVLSAIGHVIAVAAVLKAMGDPAHEVGGLLRIDDFARFYFALIVLGSLAVNIFSYPYLAKRNVLQEEFYILLLLGTLGATVLPASTHFATLFLGLETLSVSLYAMIAYNFSRGNALEAGVKYLVLAATTSAFFLFGVALLYAELGTMEFAATASRLAEGVAARDGLIMIGTAMLFVGIGFKLAVVPFHMWTPDIYQGAPAPVTAFLATVSKGSVVAVILRYFSEAGFTFPEALFIAFSVVAVTSMFIGNILAFLQNNVKRILAYSSIAHFGYLLVALLAGGALGVESATFYMVAYFLTSLGAFGIIGMLSAEEEEREALEDYRGLFWAKPWMGTAFAAMLFSLIGLPLTAGFVGKFFLVTAGVGTGLWFLVIMLVINSIIGVFYYLRIIVTLYSGEKEEGVAAYPAISLTSGGLLAVLALLLVWLGVYPGPLLDVVQAVSANLAVR